MDREPHAADIRLVDATIAGDAAAYRTLVERYERRIYRFLLKHVVCSDDAEDLAQETFLQAYRSLGAWQGKGQFSTWLTGVALNVARNYHNRSRSPATTDTDTESVLDQLPAEGSDPLAAALGVELLRALQAAIRTLPEQQRDCVMLIALEGLDYESAATVLAVPVGTIKSRLARARASLAEALKDY